MKNLQTRKSQILCNLLKELLKANKLVTYLEKYFFSNSSFRSSFVICEETQSCYRRSYIMKEQRLLPNGSREGTVKKLYTQAFIMENMVYLKGNIQAHVCISGNRKKEKKMC